MKFNQLVFLSLLISLFSSVAVAQRNDSDIIESLDRQILPITTSQPDSNFQDIEFLKESLKDKQIIGLGEATHDTHEFFQYKDRLIRFLVENLNFKAIAFESDFAQLQILDNYINGETDKMYFSGGFPVSTETKAMLNWLKLYNQTKSDNERVHIYGLETRGFKNITKLIIDSLSNLSEIDKITLLKIHKTSYNLLTKKDISELKLIIPSLYELTDLEGIPHMYKNYVRLLEQAIIYYLENDKKKIGLRDEYMYENALWIKEESINKKLIICAHNGHIAKSNVYWQSPLGKYLYQKYGDEYYVIATDFNHGEVGVIVKEKKESKYKDVYYEEVGNNKRYYEFYFSKCKFKNFFIDVKESSNDPKLSLFLKKPREMRIIGGTEKPYDTQLSISDCFDLVVFFNRTTASIIK